MKHLLDKVEARQDVKALSDPSRLPAQTEPPMSAALPPQAAAGRAPEVLMQNPGSLLGKLVRRAYVLVLGVSLALTAPLATASAKQAQPACTETTVSVVAHQDDDLLFINPDLMSDYDAGRCLVTVYMTAGDAGHPFSDYYVESREDGIREAYATMASLPDGWTQNDVPAGTRTLRSYTLNNTPTPLGVQVIFIRLPEGFPDGSGSTEYGNQSLLKLFRGTIDTVNPVDGTAGYSEQDVLTTLTTLIELYHPAKVRTLDVANDNSGFPGPADHSDHETVTRFARNAALVATPNPTLVSYMGYALSLQPRNLSTAEHDRKRDIMAHYVRHENCRPANCPAPGTGMAAEYEDWVWKKYERTRGPAQAGAFLSWVGSTDVDGTTWDKADRCMDVQGGLSGDGTVWTYACNGTPAQQWRWDGTALKTVMDGRCLTATDTGNPRVEACTGATNQVWTFTPLGQLSSGGRCLQQDDWLELAPQFAMATCTVFAEQRWDQGAPGR
ncbi:ricin-type beta-trefoil lectin domain protein [Streptomyces sp. NPDC053079]|uniref:ricin-type beta-trefoil lectin domain protein n=1 Tax=Streptomyces sp. NPDC053079 TaxID=3365697 RepID=UPI0037D4EA05